MGPLNINIEVKMRRTPGPDRLCEDYVNLIICMYSILLGNFWKLLYIFNHIRASADLFRGYRRSSGLGSAHIAAIEREACTLVKFLIISRSAPIKADAVSAVFD